MITIIANVRVRKQDRNGNTYHDVQLIDIEDNEIASRIKEGGSGTQYEETAKELIEALMPELAAEFPAIHRPNGSQKSSVSQAIEAKKVRIIYIVHNY